MTLERFAEGLRATRVDERITIEALSRRTGLSMSYISRLERAERRPSLDTLLRLASGLPLSVSEMMEELEMERPEIAYIELTDIFQKEVVLDGRKVSAELLDDIWHLVRRHQKDPLR